MLKDKVIKKLNVSMYQCINVSMYQCINVSMLIDWLKVSGSQVPG
jgi:hypothetical protein